MRKERLFEGDVQQRAAVNPLGNGLDRLREVAAVQGLVEVVDDGGEDATPFLLVEHRLGQRGEVGSNAVLQVECEPRGFASRLTYQLRVAGWLER